MASSTHHQHSRYSLALPPSSRDDSVRLPSIKDLNIHYNARRTGSQDGSPHNSNSSIAPSDTSLSQERWGRPPQSPLPMTVHIQQHHQQQHTPPLSAGHEPKNDYSTKSDGAFLTPGMPLSAQSTPVPGSVTIGPGTRGDEGHQSKRRRGSGNMSAPRDPRSPHPPYLPHYASYATSQQAPNSYPMPTPPMSHPGHPVQQPIELVHPQQVSVPGYSAYPPPSQQYIPSRVHPHAPPQQSPPTNPYPSPAPVPQNAWDIPHHAQPPLHQPPVQIQQQAQPPPPHLPPVQHTQSSQHPSHVMNQHQTPLPPPPQHHTMHSQQSHQIQQAIPPPMVHHGHHVQPQPPPQPAQPQIQHSQIQYARTTAIVPIDTRGQYPIAATMSEIIKHCQALFNFASRYAQLQQSAPDVCPPPEELAEMSHRAVEVVRLLEEYRRFNLPESERMKIDTPAVITPPDDHRPPKRPWEDMSQEETAAGMESASFAEQQYPTPVDNKAQSTAEQDMEIIRTKRATSTAGGSGTTGQPKSKYRKRSRATPPGKCHSCNIRETPEWRRGPDGARTLCNACGLHYAKLQRKRDKQAGANGDAPRIDMETLRASARAAELSDKSHTRTKHNSRSQQSVEPTSPMEAGKPLPQQHHQGSFQVVPMMPPDTGSPDAARGTAQQQPHHGMQQPATTAVPAPPWAVQQSAPAARNYAPDQLQHQSFMRTTHQTTNHTSPR